MCLFPYPHSINCLHHPVLINKDLPCWSREQQQLWMNYGTGRSKISGGSIYGFDISILYLGELAGSSGPPLRHSVRPHSARGSTICRQHRHPVFRFELNWEPLTSGRMFDILIVLIYVVERLKPGCNVGKVTWTILFACQLSRNRIWEASSLKHWHDHMGSVTWFPDLKSQYFVLRTKFQIPFQT